MEAGNIVSSLRNMPEYDVSKCISAEVQLQNSLPDWIHMATDLKLKTGLQKYFSRIQEHVHEMKNGIAAERTKVLSTNCLPFRQTKNRRMIG